MVAERTPAARAERFLQSAIRDAAAHQRTRLPPIKQMAREAGVSHGIMARAVGRLAQAGELDVCRSRGITLPGQPARLSPSVHLSRRWERLRRQIHADLSAGAFGFNTPLPSHKELQHRYGAAPRTLRRALAALAREQVLEPYRKGYRPKVHAAVFSQDRIGLFVRGTSLGRIQDFTSRVHACVYALEQECLAHRVLLQPFSCYPETRTSMNYVGRSPGAGGVARDLDACLGFIIWPAAMGEAFIDNLVRGMASRDKPLAMFWDNDEPRLWPGAADSPRLRHFTTQTDFAAGRAVGRYLLHLGHRRVRCFYSASTGWANARLAGIRREFGDAGLEDAVLEYNCRVEQAMVESLSPPWVPRLMRAAARAEAAVSRATGTVLDSATGDEIKEVLLQFAVEEMLRKKLRPALDETLADRRVTAWVGLNDAVALECLRYLQRRGIAAGREISVVGFDDSSEALFQGLTSYSFNGAAAMHAMVEYLLHPGMPRSGTRAMGVTGVEGFVHERSTSGPARAR